MCCDKFEWTLVADFDHAAGCDLDLGRCANCGGYVMCVSYYGHGNYVPVTEEQAEAWLALQKQDPLKLKAALRRWVD
jgi:hypothetical protein